MKRISIETNDRELRALLTLWLADEGYGLSDGEGSEGDVRVVDTESIPFDSDVNAVYIVEDREEIEGEGFTAIERPFSRLVLLEAVRGRITAPDVGIRLDGKRRRVYHKRAYVSLTEKEYAIFKMLYDRKDTVVLRDDIAAVARGGGQETNAADVYVCMLRRKLTELLGASPIKTVRGKGYTFSFK